MIRTLQTTAKSHWFPLVLALVLSSPLLYWASDRGDPVEIIRFEVEPKGVPPGGIIYRVLTVDRKKVCYTDPDTFITDAQSTRWAFFDPPLDRPGPLGLHAYKVAMHVPSAAALGPAALHVSVTRRCNPLQYIWPQRTVYPPIKFLIAG